jgi:hypothetical protein
MLQDEQDGLQDDQDTLQEGYGRKIRIGCRTTRIVSMG